MKAQGTLLERIRSSSSDAPRTIREDTEATAESILRYLRRLLNTRQGDARISADFGIPDCTEVMHAFPDSISDMQKAIQATIERFEPRLSKVRIRHVPSEENALELRFEVTAQLGTSREKAFLQFETWVEPRTGKVEIKG